MRIALAAAVITGLALPVPASAAVQPIYVPAQPMHLCLYMRLRATNGHGRHRFRPGWNCLPFDARRLLGLSLPDARAIASHYGDTIRRERPLAPKEGLTMDYNTGRIEVETDAPTEESTVIRIIGRG